jgi:hypothetical protein
MQLCLPFANRIIKFPPVFPVGGEFVNTICQRSGTYFGSIKRKLRHHFHGAAETFGAQQISGRSEFTENVSVSDGTHLLMCFQIHILGKETNASVTKNDLSPAFMPAAEPRHLHSVSLC